MNNRLVKLFIATTLDGYIATKDDSLEWLFKVDGKGDNGISEFYNTVDTIIMGKRTYDWIKIFEPSVAFPYHDRNCYVLTRSNIQNNNEVTFIHHDNIENLISKLKSQSGKHIWLVGGGLVVKTFLELNLIDEIIVTIAPTILGSGIPLFIEGDYNFELTLIRTRTFNQFVELHYQVNKK